MACSCGAKCFLRNWVLWVLVIVALAGLALAGFFALQPCENEPIFSTTYTTTTVDTIGAMDLVFVVDTSGSVLDADYQLEIDGIALFLRTLVNAYNGTDQRNFRAALINFANQVELTYPFEINRTAEELWLDLTTNTITRPFEGGTQTDLGLNAARDHLDEFSTDGQFRFVMLVSDGASNDDQAALTASSNLKLDNTTVAGMMVGTALVNFIELYSMTSCTDPENDALVSQAEYELHVGNCSYFAPVTDFDLLPAKAEEIANAIQVPTSVTEETVAETVESSICVEPEYLLYLLLLLPLLFYLVMLPCIYYLRNKFCPPAPLPAATATATGGGAAADGKAEGGKKWATVNAGGYLWSMGGMGTGIVEVNFGSAGAPPSAPGAALNADAVQRLQANVVAQEIEHIYGGSDTQLALSQYLCCCFWCCLSKEEKEELRGVKSVPTSAV